MSLYLGENLISGSKPINLGMRNIGELVYSPLPITDAGLHLLDGSLILGGGIYQGFVDYIANLYGDGTNIPSYFCTEAQWQTSVTTYGVCGKFVYDSTNNTVRLPKVTGKIDGTTDLSALGDLAPLMVKLPNITGSFDFADNIVKNSADAQYTSNIRGCFSASSVTANTCSVGGVSVKYNSSANRKITFDASRSSSVYSGNGTDTTIHEQAINVLLYIVIATSSKTEIQTDIDEIATDLNSKANTDLSNVTDTGYIKMAGASMPSGRYVNLTLGADGATYTAPSDGWVIVTGQGSNSSITIKQSSTNMFNTAGNSGDYYTVMIPVRKGNFNVGYRGIRLVSFKFIYAQGSESEAS